MPVRNTWVPAETLATEAVATATGLALLRLLMLMLMSEEWGAPPLPAHPVAVSRITNTPEWPVSTLGAVKLVATPVVGLGATNGPDT